MGVEAGKKFNPRWITRLVKTLEYGSYKLFLYKEFKTREGILVQGLPGIGLVGKIAVDYLVSTLKLEKVAELIGPGLLLPVGNAGVFVDQTGQMQLPSYKFYLFQGASRDIVFLTSEVQPAVWAQYEVAEVVLEFFRSVGGSSVISLCGTSSETPEIEVVYAVAKSMRLGELESLGLRRSIGGTITGACGLLPTLASLNGLEGIVIMGSTTTPEPNFESSREVIRIVSKLLGIEISLESLDKMIEEERAKRRELERELSGVEEKVREKSEGLPSWYV
ncbi:MAG: PAC2 family protein [Infirmifilum sp.]|uniref:Proteasome assembly chaperone family protein n=1 Tax=Infirmifilum uzonense TaxID=1550241 RepID=A0A0F7FFY3_9CREN|nr:PAC2 family protein [Infirmifilum uzonense]AKG38074.1 hypothetical protein MA03_00515 [Infirmifilum uzonense]